jgi:anionic cell wall polymer biosynthesis LytR-Cps2A-Psr (LCP) family protein
MRRNGIDRGVFLIGAIVVVLAGMVVFVVLSVQSDEVSEVLAAGDQLSVLIAIELPDGTMVTQGFFYQNETSRAALFDVPPDTGVVLPNLNRVDAIQTLYHSDGIERYRQAVVGLFDQPLQFYMALDAEAFESFVDLIDGIPVFVTGLPNEGPEAVRIPSGDVVLDGAKALQYLAYRNEAETVRERVARRQKIVTALLEELGAHAALFARADAARLALELIDTNIEREAFGSFAAALSGLEPDRIITRQVEGLYRRVSSDQDELLLLFPHQEGRWLQESVRQVVENIDSTESIRDENIVIRLEILNGTEVTGLASRTAALYRSYGFDVVAVGNAQSDAIESTQIIDRAGNDVFARRTADIIGASAITTRIDEAAIVDVTIVLGKDFDGTYVR